MSTYSIPIEEKEIPCRFAPQCSDSAVGRYDTPEGCVCLPEDREQDLCVQHAITAEPLGPFQLKLIYQPSLLRYLR